MRVFRPFGSIATVCAVLVGSVALAADDSPHVRLKTSEGDIVLALDAEKAPVTVENFLRYVREGYYAGTIFHRVIPGFMIQGGGLDGSLKDKTEGQHPSIKNESENGLKNETGTVAMARTSVPDSATSQFFINVKDNAFLDRSQARDGVGYAVFGRVVEGMETVRRIEAKKTTSQGTFRDVPVDTVSILEASIIDRPAEGAKSATATTNEADSARPPSPK